MRILLTITLSISTVASPLASSFLDLGSHCLLHQVEQHIASDNHADAPHGIHHVDCAWSKGGRDLTIVSSGPSKPHLDDRSQSYADLPQQVHLTPAQSFLLKRGPPLSS